MTKSAKCVLVVVYVYNLACAHYKCGISIKMKQWGEQSNQMSKNRLNAVFCVVIIQHTFYTFRTNFLLEISAFFFGF